jgi:hypothetical protein
MLAWKGAKYDYFYHVNLPVAVEKALIFRPKRRPCFTRANFDAGYYGVGSWALPELLTFAEPALYGHR